jgi:hypothetical protein
MPNVVLSKLHFILVDPSYSAFKDGCAMEIRSSSLGSSGSAKNLSGSALLRKADSAKTNVAEAVLLSLNDGVKPASFAISAKEILAAINKELGEKYTLDPETVDQADYTPEKTADRIVAGVTAFYSGYRKSNPELSDEEALDRFMKAARSGVDKGYGQAYDILKGLGAFEVEGVEEGIAKTKSLIEEKFLAFEETIRASFQPAEEPEPAAE